MKRDISDKTDIKILVDSFYAKVKSDELLGKIFDEIMQVNWEKHLPKMYDFWDNILFRTNNYHGRPFPPHLDVNDKITLTNEHFQRWIILFYTTVDEHFIGKNAEKIKFRANSIKQIFNYKINFINHHQTNL